MVSKQKNYLFGSKEKTGNIISKDDVMALLPSGIIKANKFLGEEDMVLFINPILPTDGSLRWGFFSETTDKISYRLMGTSETGIIFKVPGIAKDYLLLPVSDKLAIDSIKPKTKLSRHLPLVPTVK
jgi:hypothetical protein